MLPRTTAFGYYDHNYLGVLERLADHLPATPAGSCRASGCGGSAPGRSCSPTGAIERPLVFPDNDRPGIMLAGAARTYLQPLGGAARARASSCSPTTTAPTPPPSTSRRPACAVDGDRRLRARHRRVSGRDAPRRRRHLPYATASVVGRHRAAGCGSSGVAARLDGGGRRRQARDHRLRLAADVGRLEPDRPPSSQARGKLRFDETLAAFVPGRAARPERSAGACNGASGLAACLAEGAWARREAARAAGFAACGRRALPRVQETASRHRARSGWCRAAARRTRCAPSSTSRTTSPPRT